MGPFYHNEEDTVPQQTEYFTETGLPCPDFLSRKSEITQEEYQNLLNTVRTADAIYCPFSRRTGEPYLYMDVLRDAQGYGFSKTRIQLWTEEENERLTAKFTTPEVQVVRIEAGEDKRGIPAFLGMAFYENGAQTFSVNGTDYILHAEELLPKPDLDSLPQQQRPLFNPDLMRCSCQLAQLAGQESPIRNDLEQLYLGRFGNALRDARVLLPLLADGSGEAGTCFSVPSWKGRDGREYVRVFTDRRRLQKGMDPDKVWSTTTETVAGLLKNYDVALNNSIFRDLSIYITPAFYNAYCQG